MNEPEEDLLARFRDGDPATFDGLVLRFQDSLVGFFYRLCWDRYLAEDLTQEVFIRMVRASKSYRPTGRLDTFVFRIARNLWIDQVRVRTARPAQTSLDRPLAEDGDSLGTRIAGQGPGPTEQVEAQEERRLLREALEELSPAHRLVFELAVYQELPYKEISQALDIPLGTVKSRMFHSLRQLRDRLSHTERQVEKEGG